MSGRLVHVRKSPTHICIITISCANHCLISHSLKVILSPGLRHHLQMVNWEVLICTHLTLNSSPPGNRHFSVNVWSPYSRTLGPGQERPPYQFTLKLRSRSGSLPDWILLLLFLSHLLNPGGNRARPPYQAALKQRTRRGASPPTTDEFHTYLYAFLMLSPSDLKIQPFSDTLPRPTWLGLIE